MTGRVPIAARQASIEKLEQSKSLCRAGVRVSSSLVAPVLAPPGYPWHLVRRSSERGSGIVVAGLDAEEPTEQPGWNRPNREGWSDGLQRTTPGTPRRPAGRWRCCPFPDASAL